MSREKTEAPTSSQRAPQHLIDPEATRDHSQSGTRVSQPVEARCSDGRACIEVTARLQAGHRTKYVENCPEHGEQLITTARRIAELHAHGSACSDVEQAS